MKFHPFLEHTLNIKLITVVGVTESLPLSGALDQTCCRRGPLGNHLDLLPAGSECETSVFRCSCRERMAGDQSSTTEKSLPTLQCQ